MNVQRAATTLTTVVGVLAAGLAVWVGVQSIPSVKVVAKDAAVDAAPSPREVDVALDAALPDDAGVTEADASPEPSDLRLTNKAPKQVRFGVVLVTYAGAEGAPKGARAKTEAAEVAKQLAADAQSDFHAAVQRGDSGSLDDAGRIPRGVLEPQVEFALFTLAPGGVSGVLETPRGYWIVKRIE